MGRVLEVPWLNSVDGNNTGSCKEGILGERRTSDVFRCTILFTLHTCQGDALNQFWSISNSPLKNFHHSNTLFTLWIRWLTPSMIILRRASVQDEWTVWTTRACPFGRTNGHAQDGCLFPESPIQWAMNIIQCAAVWVALCTLLSWWKERRDRDNCWGKIFGTRYDNQPVDAFDRNNPPLWQGGHYWQRRLCLKSFDKACQYWCVFFHGDEEKEVLAEVHWQGDNSEQRHLCLKNFGKACQCWCVFFCADKEKEVLAELHQRWWHWQEVCKYGGWCGGLSRRQHHNLGNSTCNKFCTCYLFLLRTSHVAVRRCIIILDVASFKLRVYKIYYVSNNIVRVQNLFLVQYQYSTRTTSS